jgi:long-chain acyl-CoA synthetase
MGGIVVPMNVLLKRREVAFSLGDPQARLVLAWHEFADEARAGAQEAGAECVIVAPGEFEQILADATPARGVAAKAASDTAVILYTSGTTGRPKGAELTHANLRRNVEAMTDIFSLGHDDVVLGALPLFHAFGQTCGLNVVIAAGACLSLIARFDAGAGLSETSPVESFNHPDRDRKPGSIGTPIAGVEMKLVNEGGADAAQGEVGEIAIRGHNVMKSYWQRPDATAEAISADGWLRTGDLARVDDEGCFFIVDRKKELIIRGGYNVYPREIEEVLYEHPAVQECAVIGIPDASLGEEVGAAVALKAGAEVTAEQLRAFVKSQVAAYKYPRHLWLVDALPKGPTGKILKREIAPPAELAAAQRRA